MFLLHEILGTLTPDVTDGDFIDILQDSNIPGLLPLGAAGVGGMIVVVKWMVKLQREFTDVYIKENQKLRDEVEGLKAELHEKDETIIELKTSVGDLTNQVQAHERTINTLNDIIERRKNGGPPSP